ncbi:hypothetical protein [Hymenobacter lapidarius]|nr:hypothetical protein [Hymenobacter lapidarius]
MAAQLFDLTWAQPSAGTFALRLREPARNYLTSKPKKAPAYRPTLFLV